MSERSLFLLPSLNPAICDFPLAVTAPGAAELMGCWLETKDIAERCARLKTLLPSEPLLLNWSMLASGVLQPLFQDAIDQKGKPDSDSELLNDESEEPDKSGLLDKAVGSATDWLAKNLLDAWLNKWNQPPRRLRPGWQNAAWEAISLGRTGSDIKSLGRLANLLKEPYSDDFRQADKSPLASTEESSGFLTSGLWRQLWERLARADQFETNFAAELEKARIDLAYNLAYGAGHDINNPLANISSRAQALQRDERDPERRRKLAAIQAQAQRAHEMLVDLMLFARPPKLEPREIDLAKVVAPLIEELRSRAADQGTKLLAEFAAASIVADPVQLAVAVRALMVNAIEAVARGGEVKVQVRPVESGGAEVVVSDTGKGMTPEVRQKIFDPFFSGREAGRGLGFGLCKVWRIVEAHGGQVIVESNPGEGATFRLSLPATGSK